MTRFVVGDDRSQSTLFPERLDDYLGDDNPVRAIDVFVEELDLAELGFGGEQRSHPRCKLLRLAWMIRRGIEQALMQAKHIVTGPLGRKIVDRAPSLP